MRMGFSKIFKSNKMEVACQPDPAQMRAAPTPTNFSLTEASTQPIERESAALISAEDLISGGALLAMQEGSEDKSNVGQVNLLGKAIKFTESDLAVTVEHLD